MSEEAVDGSPARSPEEVMEIAVGICAYNEEYTIERSIRSVYSQKTPGIDVKEVLVVSSGSTDGTDDIVRRLQGDYPNLRLYPHE